jgi:hypothetical protein
MYQQKGGNLRMTYLPTLSCFRFRRQGGIVDHEFGNMQPPHLRNTLINDLMEHCGKKSNIE